MLILNLILFLVFLFILIKCATYAIRYSSRLARILHFPEFVVSFLIVALISVLPESTISIISAIHGKPELGLGTLLGSNVADLTLVFGVVALFSSRKIKVKSQILQNNLLYIILLLFPLLLGIDGNFSRLDGSVLLILGIFFYVRIYREGHHRTNQNHEKQEHFIKNFIFLIVSLGILIASAFLTVEFATNFAHEAKLPEIIIGLTVLAIGTCLPELIFSIKAVRKNHDELALGDVLGTVITDATIILGIVALISPFNYDAKGLYMLAASMFLAGILVISFMKSDKSISKFEGVLLLLLYIIFLFIQVFSNNVF